MCDAEMLNSSLSEDLKTNERESLCESENSLPENNKEILSDDDFYLHQDDDDVIIEFLDKSNPIVGGSRLLEHLYLILKYSLINK